MPLPNATGDHNWIHVDVERAKREMPGGKTIAHGYLTLSLMPKLSKSGLSDSASAARASTTAPTACASPRRFRSARASGLTETLKSAEPIEGGFRFTFESTAEVEGEKRPAMIAETVVLMFD